MAGMDLRISSFNDGGLIPARHSRDGGNISPALEWSTVPACTKELLLMCVDPDAPRGTFLHWLVTGIDPSCTSVAEGETPKGGTPWRNGFGEVGYGGPRPPAGSPAHRYQFCLFALFAHPRLPADPTPAEVNDRIESMDVAAATVTGLFQC